MSETPTSLDVAVKVAETPDYPEIIVKDWPCARRMLALGYWITRVTRRKDTKAHRPRFEYRFRCYQSEIDAVLTAYHSSAGLKIDVRDFEKAEQDLIRYQKTALDNPSGEWVDS